jgi:deoxyribodipyrimidine photolyase-related protein
MTAALRLILGDQLTPDLPILTQADRQRDIILLCEVREEATYVKHHQQKIAFLFSAMRHFAAELREQGYHVRYVTLDDPANSGSFDGEVARALQEHGLTRVIVTEPGEWRVLQKFRNWPEQLAITPVILPDTRFLCSHETFTGWARGKKQLRMEFFYRLMRQQHNMLLQPDGAPEGGAWNFDKENRKPPPAKAAFPPRHAHAHSAITREVLALVKTYFADHFGALEAFDYAVTRSGALQDLDFFISRCLPHFGDYQDAMMVGEAYLYHARLSAYLNAGLLLPLEVCQRAEVAYRAGQAPLNAVEGFIRQILGWREFIRGIYWLQMPGYAALNTLNATEPLPDFYWTAETRMHCVAEAVRQTRDHAYSHHIQRLMVTGNFALLAGLDVRQVQEWYLAVYADAYEWVEMPNTLGMALFGDGGIVGSKPYAASGKYIKRMSNYCRGCAYDPEATTGPTACPFNALYWDFMARHAAKLGGNQRMPYVYATWEKFGPAKQQAIRQQAQDILARMRAGAL